MDQNAILNDEIESGRRLIEALAVTGFEVPVAFWAKPSDGRKWYLYLASPLVDEKGVRAGYQIVLPVVQRMPELGLDPFGITLLGVKDGMTQDVLEAIKPRVPSPLAGPNPKPYRGMTRFTGDTLGGVEIDAAYIYPLLQPTPAA